MQRRASLPTCVALAGDPNDAASFDCVQSPREGDRPLFGTTPRGPK